jgi:hypothetical protein
MGKGKAYTLTAIIVIFAAVLVWLLWENAIRAYWVVCQIIALYGFVRGAIDLGKWIAKPQPSPTHLQVVKPEDFTENGWGFDNEAD